MENQPLTMEQIKTMSKEELAERIEEVRLVMDLEYKRSCGQHDEQD